jgi:hypothetical protein
VNLPSRFAPAAVAVGAGLWHAKTEAPVAAPRAASDGGRAVSHHSDRKGRLRRLALTAAGAALLAGCSLGSGVNPPAQVDPEEADMTRDRPASSLGDLIVYNREGGPAGQNLPVNKHLWRASLDTLRFLPLVSTDPFSGVIATDWASNPDTPEERYKVTVYVSQPTLEARALKVAVFRERRGEDGAWTPAPVSDATPRRLEDAILTRARQLRVAELEAEEQG